MRFLLITNNMYSNLLSIFLMVNLAGWCCTYTIQPIEFELLDDKFRLSIPNDPDIKWVSFNVNINKEFEGFESGQLTGVTSIPRDRKWTYEFERALKDSDIVYVWLAVQHNRLIFRDKKDPISVEAFKGCTPNCKFTTTTSKPIPPELSTESPTPIDVTSENKICRPTISEVPKEFGGPYCRDALIFSDNFDTFNAQYWTNEIRIPPTTDDAEFVLYNGTLGVENGVLKIEASLNMKKLKKDSIDLGTRCTSINVDKECSLNPRGFIILPPIISGRLSSKNYFNFKYGRIEVRAKMPIGEWLYPLISLQPNTLLNYGERYKSGEIRVAYIHGNQMLQWQNKNIDGSRLYGGAIVNPNAELRYQFMKDITLPNVTHFGDDFHLYSLTWTPNQLVLHVDGNEYGRIKTDFKEHINEPIWNRGQSNAPLDKMFYITLGLAAGGNGDFPTTEGKPWNNTDPKGSINFHRNRAQWFPSWEQPSLEVDYVRVYAV